MQQGQSDAQGTKAEHYDQAMQSEFAAALFGSQEEADEAEAELLDHGDPPQNTDHVWLDFLELCARRQYSAGGPNPLSHREIECYERLEEITLEPWELRAIRRLDDAWIGAWKDGRSSATRTEG